MYRNIEWTHNLFIFVQQRRRFLISSLKMFFYIYNYSNNFGIWQIKIDNSNNFCTFVTVMETVYQRRELKKAGAKVSIPNKGGHTRLGELANGME